jgi:phage tail tape-measure protein
MIGGHFKVNNPLNAAFSGMNQAAHSYGSMMQGTETKTEKKPSAGGALQGAIGGAAAGTAILPGWGTAIGAGIGLLAGLFG